MTYLGSEPDFLNFVINSLSSKSVSDDSESDFSPVFMNLDICVFLPYIYNLLNKLADDFFINSHNRINSYTSIASIMHISFWHIIIQKVCFYYTIKLSYFSF